MINSCIISSNLQKNLTMILFQPVFSLLISAESGETPTFELGHHILGRCHIDLVVFLYVLILSGLP